MRLVLVTWRDAWLDTDEPSSGYREDYMVSTVGWLVREDEHIVSVASELLPVGEGVRAVTHIPATSVVRTVDLHPAWT